MTHRDIRLFLARSERDEYTDTGEATRLLYEAADTIEELVVIVRRLHAALGAVHDYGTATEGHGHPDTQNRALDDAEALLERLLP